MIKILYGLIALLPHSWARQLGSIIGGLMYRFNNREKRVAAANIALCFPNLEERAQQHLLKKTLQENAKTLLELPRIFKRGGAFSISLISEVQGLEYYKRALTEKRGVILLAPHLGNWELTVHYLNQFENITAMYAPPKQKFLDEIMRNARQSSGAVLVPAEAKGVRAQLRQLKKGGVVGILPDQVPQQESAGVYAPFMGKNAFTMTLVNNLARRSGASVLMTFAERYREGFRLHVFPAPKEIGSEDPVLAAAALNIGIEQCINIAPAQYQWTYKRFKHQPNGTKEPYS